MKLKTDEKNKDEKSLWTNELEICDQLNNIFEEMLTMRQRDFDLWSSKYQNQGYFFCEILEGQEKHVVLALLLINIRNQG